MTRRALQAIYAIAFLCLLRSDEVLRIEREHVKVEGNKIILTLPFRKTHRDGGELLPLVDVNSLLTFSEVSNPSMCTSCHGLRHTFALSAHWQNGSRLVE